MPVRVLMSAAAQAGAAESIARIFAGRPHAFVSPGQDADLAFVSRDVTGLSTKHVVLPETQRFYDAMLSAPSLRWVHVHSAGADVETARYLPHIHIRRCPPASASRYR